MIQLFIPGSSRLENQCAILEIIWKASEPAIVAAEITFFSMAKGAKCEKVESSMRLGGIVRNQSQMSRLLEDCGRR
jgi:hypothetical protein